MNKIIFLDIDGVLNHIKTKERFKGGKGGIIGIDQQKVLVFNRIIKETGAKVVISSSWRLMWPDEWHQALVDAGIECEIIGTTPDLRRVSRLRGLEIDCWIREAVHQGIHVDRYAIIDDDSDMLEGQPFFQTNTIMGLTEEIADDIINHLNKSSKPNEDSQ